jgi:hypothetical protein
VGSTTELPIAAGAPMVPLSLPPGFVALGWSRRLLICR